MSDKLPTDLYKKHLSAAHAMVSALCNGKQQWTMHVPVDENNDPDVVIGQALRDADRAVEMLETVLVNSNEAQAFRSLRELLQNHFVINIEFVEQTESPRVILSVSKPDDDSAEFTGGFMAAIEWAHRWASHK